MPELELGDEQFGLHPDWIVESPSSFVLIEVLAPCELVANAYLKAAQTGIADSMVDLSGGSAPWPKGEWERAVLIYQLKGSSWTHIHSLGDRIADDAVPPLMEMLKTRIVLYAFSDTASISCCTFFEKGGGVEDWESEDASGGDHDDDWQEDSDSGWCVRSTISPNLDISVPGANELPIQRAREWGLSVPWGVWIIGDDEFVLGEQWTPADLQSARMLWTNW